RYYLWDDTLTHSTSSYNLVNRHVKIVVTSGSSISLDSILDLSTVTSTSEHKVQVINDAGGNLDINTAEKSNFAGTYTAFDGVQAKFLIDRDGDGNINVGSAGVYA